MVGVTSLADLRALEQAAWPGPWSTERYEHPYAVVLNGEWVVGTTRTSDAEFIAAARNALPGLLARVAAAEAERQAEHEVAVEAAGKLLACEGRLLRAEAERDALLRSVKHFAADVDPRVKRIAQSVLDRVAAPVPPAPAERKT